MTLHCFLCVNLGDKCVNVPGQLLLCFTQLQLKFCPLQSQFLQENVRIVTFTLNGISSNIMTCIYLVGYFSMRVLGYNCVNKKSGEISLIEVKGFATFQVENILQFSQWQICILYLSLVRVMKNCTNNSVNSLPRIARKRKFVNAIIPIV